MRISYSRIWEDTVRLIRAHASLAIALAGVFLFLPGLLMGHFAPMLEVTDPNLLVSAFTDYFRENFHWVLLSIILSAAGTLSILMLVFRGGATSVGAAIAAAFGLLLPYVIAVVLTGIPVAIGFMLFILPGLYLMARFLPIGPVIVADGERNPIDAIRRTWALTRGHGWAILGLFLLVGVAGLVLMTVVGGIIGLVLHIALPEGLAKFMVLIVSTTTSTALQVVLIFLYAAIYRALTGAKSAESAAPAASAGPATVRSERSAD
jgi:hypothetical protein